MNYVQKFIEKQFVINKRKYFNNKFYVICFRIEMKVYLKRYNMIYGFAKGNFRNFFEIKNN